LKFKMPTFWNFCQFQHFFFFCPFIPTHLWRWNGQCFLKRWHINFIRWKISQKKAYNIQNKAKVWNRGSYNLLYNCTTSSRINIVVLNGFTWRTSITTQSKAIPLIHLHTALMWRWLHSQMLVKSELVFTGYLYCYLLCMCTGTDCVHVYLYLLCFVLFELCIFGLVHLGIFFSYLLLV
jgi:hypothetical protein